MPDAKISALPLITTPVASDELPINDAGVSRKITLDQVRAFSGRTINNASTAAQSSGGFVSDTYLVGSACAVPSATAIIVGTMYRCKFHVTKTAAGTGNPIVTVRCGVNGSTADAAVGSFTLAAQTAAVDNGFFELFTTIRQVGSGAGLAGTVLTLVHEGGTTGLNTLAAPAKYAVTGTAFTTNTASLKFGVSVAAGTSAAWTANLVQAELFNLAA